MNKLIWTGLVALLVVSPGCAAFKAKTGEFVTEAVVDHLTERVDQVLDQRGLSIAQIKSVTDADGDGQLTGAEVKSLFKDSALEIAQARTDKLYTEQKAEWREATDQLKKRLTGQSEKETSAIQDLWAWLQATFWVVVAGLGTMLWGNRKQGETSKQLAMLERLVNRDLNGDGHIGEAPRPPEDPII